MIIRKDIKDSINFLYNKLPASDSDNLKISLDYGSALEILNLLRDLQRRLK